MASDESPMTNAAGSARKARIVLADEPDFRLGSLFVRPARREVVGPDGSDTLEPRVMQVLVALVRAAGAPVSREALIDSCWDGRTVGADAIERCVSRLRRLADGAAGGAFAIETLPRVGFRLTRETPDLAVVTTGMSASSAGLRSPRTRWAVALGAAAVAAIVVSVALLGAARRGGAWRVEQAQMLVETPGLAAGPALSPGGAMIAYTAHTADGGPRRIFLRNLQPVAEPLRVSDGPGYDVAPAWSPGGDRLAYVRTRDGEPCEILTRPVPAGPEVSVGRCALDQDTTVAWTGKGDSLLFVDREKAFGPERIVRLDLASGTRRFVTDPPLGIIGDWTPTVSPDGRRLAFKRATGGLLSVVVRDLSSGAERRIAGPDVGMTGLTWSADGRALLVALQRPGDGAVWAYPLDGAAPARLDLGPLVVGSLATAPPDRLAFEVLRPRFQLAWAAAAGQGDADIQSAAGHAEDFDIASDGSLAAIAFLGGAHHILVRRPGQPWRVLPDFGATVICGVRWSPDARSLAFTAILPGGAGLFVTSGDGDRPRRVLAAPMDDTDAPAWTDGGRSLVLPILDAGKGWRLWRTDLAAATPATPITGYGWCAVRAAGGFLYAARNDRAGVWRLGGTPVNVARGHGADRCYDWTASADRVAYRDGRIPGHPRIAVESVGGRRLIDAPGLMAPFDGSTLAFDPRSGALAYLAQTDTGGIALARVARE